MTVLTLGALAAASLSLVLASSGWTQDAGEQQARVPTTHAAIHDAPSTASNMLVLVPEGTVLPVIGRQGEWAQVQLSPELRETGMVIRWYEQRHDIVRRGVHETIGQEDSGWMHDSTVVLEPAGSP